MPKAVFNKQVIAESADTILLEGVHYFPPDTVNQKYLVKSDTRAENSWKGTAQYFHVTVGKYTAKNAAWSYPEPSRVATSIADHVAFGGEVEVVP